MIFKTEQLRSGYSLPSGLTSNIPSVIKLKSNKYNKSITNVIYAQK